jgi:formylglycine-generating enzyme required for sulfatase activity
MIFISYASEDAPVADRIRTGLEQAGLVCWIAPRDIEPGTSFPAAITAAISGCTAQVLLLTAQANASRHVLSEVELAFNAGKPILAVLVGKVAPSPDLQYFISTSHWFDADSTFDDSDLAKLRLDIEKLVSGARRRPSPPVVPPVAWYERPAVMAAVVAGVLIAGTMIYVVSRREPAPAPVPEAATAPPAAAPSVTPPPAATPSSPAPAVPAASATVSTPPASPRSKLNTADGQTYVWIPPGSFAMGCSSGDGDCESDEMPTHTVRIRRGFWLGRTEVTRGQYEKRVKPQPRPDGATSNDPAVNVDWSEAKAYCAAIGGRLPTEAEWEYAARAGSRDRYYDTLSAVAWFENNSDDHSHPVGRKAPNAYGLHDMLGNVYEWVLDRYYNTYDDTTEEIEEPLAPNASAVARGGAWHSAAKDVRVSNRFAAPKDYADANVGVRCALDDR